MALILPQYTIDNKTFSVNYTEKGFLYGIKLDSIVVDDLLIDEREISFIPGTNNVRVKFSGVNV